MRKLGSLTRIRFCVLPLVAILSLVLVGAGPDKGRAPCEPEILPAKVIGQIQVKVFDNWADAYAHLAGVQSGNQKNFRLFVDWGKLTKARQAGTVVTFDKPGDYTVRARVDVTSDHGIAHGRTVGFSGGDYFERDVQIKAAEAGKPVVLWFTGNTVANIGTISGSECEVINTNCVCTDNGTLSGGTASNDGDVCLGNPIKFHVDSDVVDSGGQKECTDHYAPIAGAPPGTTCSDVTYPVSIPAATPTYTWTITGPDGGATGAGPVATYTPTQCGTYSCTFTASVGRECPPPSVTISAGSLDILKVDFLKNDNSSVDPATEALNVANYVTTDGLPKDSATAFATTCNDPDNFRIEVDDATASGASVDVKLQVNSAAETTYTLNKQSGSKFRGLFLRLVADAEDDAASEHGATNDPDKQTVLVSLGDTVRVKYEPSPGTVFTRELQVGRPASENDNGANQLRHDIRVLKVRVVVFRNADATGPAATRPQVEADMATLRERYAQSTISINVLEIDMGGTGDPGVTLPAAFASGNYTSSRGGAVGDDAGEPTPSEQAIVGYKDADDNSIDIFYVDGVFVGPVEVGGIAYITSLNLSGNAAYARFCVVSGINAVPFTVAHECLHILLNIGHRNISSPMDFIEALFFSPTSLDRAVDGTKRIGPYPPPTLGGWVDDTYTIREVAESLP